jgi:hypothetical protein
MRYFLLHLAAAAASLTAAPSEGIEMRIQMTIGNTTVTGALLDNPTARDFYSMLPLTVTLEDYAATEKITYLSRRLITTGSPENRTPAKGDIGYYAPWGNVVFYYRDGPLSPGLVPLGRIESGLEALEAKGSRKVLIEKAGK